MHKEIDAVTKLYDLLLWMVPKLEKFPRSQKFLLGDRIEKPDARHPRPVDRCGVFKEERGDALLPGLVAFGRTSRQGTCHKAGHDAESIFK
jgi:hypothetical protein